jgi:SAM-dependent methyltransferase
MASRGFQVVALDISLDPVDGLGALVMLPQELRARICPVRADFDSLPFAPGEFDLVVFNASLHYSSDAARTLAAAMEVLDRRSILYILDSPFYTYAEGGEEMIQEWNRGFMRRFNRQVSEPGPKGYLTLNMLKELNTRYRVECITPAYGLRWALRPYIARFLRRREPATFRIAAIYKE